MNEKKYFETIDNIILEPTIIDDKVMKEFYIPGYKDIKMLSFFDVNYDWLLEKINDKTIGIYFLINENLNSIYVGQSTDLISRLKKHYQNKEFSKVILFFGDDEWTETIISYLEHKFILEFKKNNLFFCVNSKNEREPKHNSWEKQVVNKSFDIIKKLLVAENIIIFGNHSFNIFANINNKENQNKIINDYESNSNLFEYIFSEDNLDLTNSKPKSIKIFNDKIEINSLIDIWKNIVIFLTNENKDKMLMLANQEWRTGRTIDITTDFKFLRRPYEILKNELYIETNLSGNDILKKSRKLLEIFNIDLKNISISLNRR